MVAAEHARAELLAHAVAHDHLLRDRGDLLEVVRGAGRDLVEDELLRGAAAERHRELLHQRGLGRQVAVLARERDRVAERLAAADDRDLVHLVGVLEVVADDRVAELVVGGDLALLLGEQPRLLLGAGDHAHDPFLELLLLDRLLAAARREQRGLVDEVRQVGAGEAGRAGGERVEVDLGRDRLALGVHLEDLAAADAVGPVDDDLPVEAARAQQRRVEDVGPVRGRDQDDVVLQLEAVHLDEQLVERLLALVVAAAEARAAVPADGVDLVHEDDARARPAWPARRGRARARRRRRRTSRRSRSRRSRRTARRPRPRPRARAASYRCRAARRAGRPSGSARRAPGTSSGSRGTP